MELHWLTHKATQKDHVHFEAWANAFKQLAFMYLLVVFVLFAIGVLGLFCFCIAPYFISLCKDIYLYPIFTKTNKNTQQSPAVSLKKHKLQHWFTLFFNFRVQSDFFRGTKVIITGRPTPANAPITIA